MIFIDTNYFLRFLRDDVPEQSRIVKKLFLSASKQESRLFTSTLVFFEVFWVAKSVYGEHKAKIITLLQQMLDLNFVEIKERKILDKSLKLFLDTNIEFEDCYNITYAKEHKMKKFATFDKKILKNLQSSQ